MNTGVKLLIERMKTNPEEFGHNRRFSSYADVLDKMCKNGANDMWYLSEEDREALKQAWRDFNAQKFSNAIMERLLKDTGTKSGYTVDSNDMMDAELMRIKLMTDYYNASKMNVTLPVHPKDDPNIPF